jgi:hypothetical protein
VRMSSRGRSCAGQRVSRVGGSTRMGADVLIVADDIDRTERELMAGELVCPDCQGELRPWGHARARRLRTRHATRQIRPRRARCRACNRTHVLLAGVAVLRRADAVESSVRPSRPSPPGRAIDPSQPAWAALTRPCAAGCDASPHAPSRPPATRSRTSTGSMSPRFVSSRAGAKRRCSSRLARWAMPSRRPSHRCAGTLALAGGVLAVLGTAAGQHQLPLPAVAVS